MKKTFKILLATLVATLAMIPGGTLRAQNGTMSPYSRYGYGILRDNATSAQRSMGGTGYAMQSGRQINAMNPASYAAIDSLTFLFDMGVDLTSLWSEENGRREQDWGGGLDYITMQVPVGRYMGASLGLVPFASTGYSFGSAIDNGSVSRSGTGSINQLYLGWAGRPFKGFTVGAHIAYLFGSVTNDLYAVTSSGSSSIFERQMSVSDWRTEFGVQYGFNINPSNRVTLGLVYAPQKGLRGKSYGIYYDTSVDKVQPDTVAGDHSLKGRYSLPETWGAGLAWNWRSRLLVEADFTYQPWSKAKYAAVQDFEQTRMANRYKGALGFQYTPDPRGNYGQRIQYRLGGYYDRGYVMIGDNHTRDIGLTMGMGLPVPGYKSVVNIGFEWRNRRCTPNPLIKENYLNITVGINFNEMWFRKNKLY